MRLCSIPQPYLTISDPMDCSLAVSSVHGIFQARVLEWVAISYSRGSFWSRDRTRVSCISCLGRRILYHWATWEPCVCVCVCVCVSARVLNKHMYWKSDHFSKELVGGSTEDRCLWCAWVMDTLVLLSQAGRLIIFKASFISLAVLQPEKPGSGVEEAQNQDFPTPPSPTIIPTANYKECPTGPRQQDVP